MADNMDSGRISFFLFKKTKHFPRQQMTESHRLRWRCAIQATSKASSFNGEIRPGNILKQPLILNYSGWGTNEFYNLSPGNAGILKYITRLVILDTDDDPEDVGLPPSLGPDLQSKKGWPVKSKAGPPCTDAFFNLNWTEQKKRL